MRRAVAGGAGAGLPVRVPVGVPVGVQVGGGVGATMERRVDNDRVSRCVMMRWRGGR